MSFKLKIERRTALNYRRAVKYVLYSTGEVFLIFLGILIAIYFNGRSETIRNEEKIKKIFAEIQNNLAKEIEETTNIIAWYAENDSLTTLVINDKATAQDYISNEKLQFLITHAEVITFRRNGYTLLQRNYNILPDRYYSLLPKIDSIYIADYSRCILWKGQGDPTKTRIHQTKNNQNETKTLRRTEVKTIT